MEATFADATLSDAIMPEAESAALRLQSLTLFAGTGKGFALDRTGTRAEGAVLLVRLLGGSKEASTMKITHPFGDVPAWAAGSVELLWRKGITTGVSAMQFGAAQEMTGRQYGTFLLRALGYGNGATDLYGEAVGRLLLLGLLQPEDPVAKVPDAPISRASMVLLSERVLSHRMVSGTRTLLDTLVLGGQVPADAAGIWLAARMAPDILGNAVTEYDRVKALHDWLVLNNRYGWLSSVDDPQRRLSAEGYTALSLGTGVCSAYSEAMKFLCDEADIGCSVIQGRAEGVDGWSGHAWNQVRVDGAWYHMDVTFDDPVGTDVLRYNYFNITDADIAADHVWDRTAWPACTATAANWFVHNDMTVSSFNEFRDNVREMVANRETELLLRAVPYSSKVYSAATIRSVLLDTGLVAGYTQSLDDVMGVIRLSGLRYHEDAGG